MSYQDQKINAIYRLLAAAMAITALLAVSLIYPQPVQNVVEHLPLSRRGDGYAVWLGILTTVAPICWAVILGLVFTSPEQEVRFVRWSRRWRKTPIEFEKLEFDATDPNYRKATWRYFVDRHKR